MPHTKLGKWSVGLIIGFIVLLLVFYGLVLSGQRGGEKYFDNLILAIPFTLAGLCGIAAFITGILAVLMKRERTILVFLAIAIGAFVIIFLSGEIISPH